jgi:hypothetical protein
VTKNKQLATSLALISIQEKKISEMQEQIRSLDGHQDTSVPRALAEATLLSLQDHLCILNRKHRYLLEASLPSFAAE